MKRNTLFKDSNVAVLGDICFFSLEHISSKKLENLLKPILLQKQEWHLKLSNGKAEMEPFWFYYQLRDYYRKLKHLEKYAQIKPDLDWFYKLPQTIQDHIWFEHVSMDSDPFAILPSFNFTSFGYIIEEGGLVEDFYNTFAMHRLFNVRQLGFMHDPVHRERGVSNIALPFNHKRGLHQLDVYAIMALIISRNPILESKRNVLLAAAVSHDGKTPAGGDTTKLVNPELFDEEKNYKDFFKLPGVKSLLQNYNIDQEELNSIVLGEGLLGSILDIADKIAYTARDAYMFLELRTENFKHRSELFVDGCKLIMKDENICDLWKDVVVIGDKVAFKNAKKVFNFLKLRAIMFSSLYYKRESRFLEYLFYKKVIKYLFNKGIITLDKLMNGTDEILELFIGRYLGIECLSMSFDKSLVKVFKYKSEALDFYENHLNDPDFFVIFDDFIPQTSSAVKKFNVLRKNKVISFQEAYPKESVEIENIIRFPEEYGVYMISLKDLRIPKSKYHVINDMKRS